MVVLSARPMDMQTQSSSSVRLYLASLAILVAIAGQLVAIMACTIAPVAVSQAAATLHSGFLHLSAVDFSALTDEEDNAFAAIQTVVEETTGTSFIEGEDEPAMRTLANYGFSRSHCERALADATASGVEDGELERTAAAVKWLKEEAKLEPLFTEWSPYEDDVGTAVRVAHFLAWLRGRPEGHILVSTHCMFLYTLFGRHDAMADVMLCDNEVSPSYFARGECRTVQILFDDCAKL